MIPKILHFIWIDNPIPGWAWENIATFNQPGWQTRIHTDDTLINPAYAPIYNRVGIVPMKTDLLRLSILQHEPGWYIDTDSRALAKLDDLYGAFEYVPGKLAMSSTGHRPINWVIGADADFDWTPITEWIVEKNKPMHPAWFGAYMMFFHQGLIQKINPRACSTSVLHDSIIAHGFKGT